MKRWHAVLALAVLAVPVAAQELDVAIKEVEPFPYCAIAHKGPYTDMGAVIQQLMGAIAAQGLFARIRGPLVGVYHNAPQNTPPEDLLWEAGFPVEAQTTTRPPLVLKTWEHRMVAAALYVGPYDGAGPAIEKIMAWLGSNGYEASGPVLERYLDQDPSAVDPAKLRTEIWVPYRKR